MNDLTAGEWLAVAALAVACLSIPITVWATRAYGTRRARLLFNWRAVPLLPESNQHGLLKLTYREFDVVDPHLVTISLANIGPTDIASAAFDQGRGIRVDLLNTVFYGVVSLPPAKDRGEIISEAIGTKDGHIIFRPGLLRRRQVWTVEVLVSGETDAELTSSLIDTDIVSTERPGLEVGIEVASVAVNAVLPGVGVLASALRRRS